ncbi:hypothetical protein [Paraburkholderia atlantica]|uniref:hypothetical protein n=1 Tax=Paraburkholderia atlantica TaxID=2654982 RepID=UPI001620ACF9|nr:hypothetical protein [Paraburkholderia atlantica]MBB5506259.1 hypothetical protein [Paraburkholderia atlantica]
MSKRNSGISELRNSNGLKNILIQGDFYWCEKRNIPIFFANALGDIGVWLMHD